MFYTDVIEGTFVKRMNRFTALAMAEGRERVVHVKNTGRLGELLAGRASILGGLILIGIGLEIWIKGVFF